MDQTSAPTSDTPLVQGFLVRFQRDGDHWIVTISAGVTFLLPSTRPLFPALEFAIYGPGIDQPLTAVEIEGTRYDISDPAAKRIPHPRKGQDDNYRDEEIRDVQDVDPEFWQIGFDDGLMIIRKRYGVVPRPGQTARIYYRGQSNLIRGIDVDGVEVFYLSEGDHRFAMKRDQDLEDRRRWKEYVANKDKYDEAWAKLPRQFQDRRARLARNNPRFWRHEAYELFCCEQAVAIAHRMQAALENAGVVDWELATEKWAEAFYEMPDEERQQLVPEYSPGHSGNTLGVSITLAVCYVTHPEWVDKHHAAMCPLHGCAGAGCFAAEEHKSSETETTVTS